MRDAFRRAGAEVRTVGPDFGPEIWGMKLDARRAWRADGTIDTVWPDWMPDIVIYSIPPPFQFNPHYRGIPHVVHTVDNHVCNFRHEGIDHYFLADRKSSVMPIERPEDTWLPCAYDPLVFTPSPSPWSKREFDVALVGVMYPHRLEIVNAMTKAGFKVVAGIGAVYEEFRNIYQNARISLCPSAHGGVGQRIFETASMNCLILADPCPDFLPLNADGLVIYENVPDAVEKVRLYLSKSAAAEAMIARSSAWAKPHTWDARAIAILQWLEARPAAG
jgi:hypothetical protein